MRAPAKPKPRAADEVVRVVRTFYMLIEELHEAPAIPMKPQGVRVDVETVFQVAERIAARTEG